MFLRVKQAKMRKMGICMHALKEESMQKRENKRFACMLQKSEQVKMTKMQICMHASKKRASKNEKKQNMHACPITATCRNKKIEKSACLSHCEIKKPCKMQGFGEAYFECYAQESSDCFSRSTSLSRSVFFLLTLYRIAQMIR